MRLKSELKQYYINKKGDINTLMDYAMAKLPDDASRGLYKATVRFLRALCGSQGGVSPNRIIDALAADDGPIDYKILRTLIREYDGGVESILDAYDDYFELEEEQDFWMVFNTTLDLPEDWYNETITKLNNQDESR